MEIYNTIGWALIGITVICMVIGRTLDWRLSIPCLWGIFLVWTY